MGTNNLAYFATGPSPDHKKVFLLQFTNVRNKLECLSLASISSLVT